MHLFSLHLKAANFLIFLLFTSTLFAEGSILEEHSLRHTFTTIWNDFSELLLKNGLWLFSGIAILPAFILPVSPLLALAGIWGETHGAFYAALLGSLALTLNCCWTYWLASWFGPKFLDYIYFFFRKKKFSNIEKPKKTLWQWALILRLTPGIPFIFGNYLLGSFKMPFITYLMISIPILSANAFGYTFAVSGLASGDFEVLSGGIAILILIYLIGKYLISQKKNAG